MLMAEGACTPAGTGSVVWTSLTGSSLLLRRSSVTECMHLSQHLVVSLVKLSQVFQGCMTL